MNRVSGGCLGVVWRVSGRCLECIMEVLEDVWKVSACCKEGSGELKGGYVKLRQV